MPAEVGSWRNGDDSDYSAWRFMPREHTGEILQFVRAYEADDEASGGVDDRLACLGITYDVIALIRDIAFFQCLAHHPALMR